MPVNIEDADAIRSLDDLRKYVHHVLCDRESLLADQFKMAEMQLTRCGRACGLQFCLQGPRNVRLAAIWAAEHNLLYFYDANGERFLKLKLKQRLAPAA
jgi:hypothetical protein